MPEKSGDVVQGTLDMLILKTLALESMHGYGIAVRIEQMSKGVFKVNAGSLFVALQRLERAGLTRSEWKEGEKGLIAKRVIGDGKSRQSPEFWRRHNHARIPYPRRWPSFATAKRKD